MRGDKCIHISFETQLGINWLLIEFDLDKTIWISSYDKVNFCPVNHYYFFDVVYDIW